MPVSRIKSIDVFRLLGILAVIAIHTVPFEGAGESPVELFLCVAINQGARFAVPMFFILSGWFFAQKVERCGLPAACLQTVKRLGGIWLFFCAFYLLPLNLPRPLSVTAWDPLRLFANHFEQVAAHPVAFIFQGSSIHLWFLMSLLQAVLITTFFIHCFRRRPLIPLFIVGGTLYVFGLLAKSYSETPWGIHVPFNTRNGPFFSFPFFVLGYALSRLEFKLRHFFWGAGILAVGTAIHFGEIFFLYRAYDISPVLHDFVAGTIAMGLGSGIMALSRHPLVTSKTIAWMGQYTLGLYGMHFLYVRWLQPLDARLANPFWEIGEVFLVFSLSLGTVFIMGRMKGFRSFIR